MYCEGVEQGICRHLLWVSKWFENTFVARRTRSASTLRCNAASCTTTDPKPAFDTGGTAALSLAAVPRHPLSRPPPSPHFSACSPAPAVSTAAEDDGIRKRALYSATSSAFGVRRTMAGGGRMRLLPIFSSTSNSSRPASFSPSAADDPPPPPSAGKRTNVYRENKKQPAFVHPSSVRRARGRGRQETNKSTIKRMGVRFGASRAGAVNCSWV